MDEAYGYIKVSEDEDEANAIEIPCEQDGTLLLTTLVAQFPGVSGLKYRHPCSNTMRGIRLSEGKLHPPSETGWNNLLYICVFPKESKRKIDDTSYESSAAKNKKFEKKICCSDLICLGLPWKVTEESVRKYFEQFGEVVMVQLKYDRSNTFKGYGFIRFATYASQMRALSQRHNMDGRWVDVRVPNSKDGLVPKVPCKVYVGRCTENLTADVLREYFSQFGEVTDVFVPRPFRAFAFVTFLDPEVAQSLCGEDHMVKGTSVSVSSAEPKTKNKANQNWNENGDNSSWDKQSGRGFNNYQGNVDTLSMQNLGINPNSNNAPSINLPISLVAAALNQAGWNGLQGPNNQPSWNNMPPANNQGNHSNGNVAKNWN